MNLEIAVEAHILISKVNVFLNLYFQKMEILRLHDETENANLELIKANKQMAEFVGIVSHDLRDPVGNISYICDILNETPEDLSIFLPELKANSKNAQNLISDFLDIAAISSGMVNIDLQGTALSSVNKQSIQGLKFLADNKNILNNI